MENRLQFLHHSEQFATREAAMTYALTEINRGYFSLYAEPLVMKYGDDTENPHIILCIGAKTNDTDIIANNKLCFIDIDKTETEIVELNEKIDEAIAALTLTITDTNTVDLTIDDTGGHPNLSADVKLAPTAIFNNIVRENILTTTEDGVFTYVNLDYDENEEKFIFTVNGVTKEMQILNEDYVVNGTYSLLDESIHLIKKSGDEIIIPMADLINEWKADAGTETPVILTRVRHEFEPGNHQDILFGDVRLSDDSRNILEKEDNGRSLIVKGTANNIKYWSGSTLMNVQDAIDAQLKLSADNDNVIYLKGDGLFANMFLTYTAATNTLTFTKTNYSGGTSSADIQLAGFSFIDGAHYDPTTEEIVIEYTDNTGTRKTLRIPVSGMFSEWDVSNPAEGSAVELTKSVHSVSGTDLLSAKVLISNEADNIAEIKNNRIYVSKSGITENANKIGTGFTSDPHENVTAKFNTLSGAVDAEVTRATAAENALNTAIQTEVARATAAETALDTAIQTEVARATAAEDALNTALTAAINSEVTRATNRENELAQSATTLDNKIGTGFTADPHENVTAKFNTLSGAVDAEVTRATAAENALSAAIDSHVVHVADTSSVKMTMTGADNTIQSEVKIGVGANNIVFTDEVNSGISASIDLSYDMSTNKLTLTTSNMTGGTSSKEVQLEGFTIVDNAYYDSTTEEIVIEYKDNTGTQKELRIPVRGIIDEIDVDNTNKTVTLTLTKNPTTGPDILTADVNVGSKAVFETQILEVIDNKLVVKGEASNIKYSDSNVEAALDSLVAHDTVHNNQIDILSNTIGGGFGTSETTTVTYKFNKLRQDVDSEISRSTAKDSELENALDNEVTRAQDVEATLTQGVSDLTSKIGTGFTTDPHENVTAKFNIMSDSIDALSDEVDTKEAALSAAITAEETRATAAETALNTAITNEVTRSTNKDTELTQSATTLENKIGTGFTTGESSNITAKFNALTNTVDAEVTRATAAETALNTAITNEVTRSTNKDTELTQSATTLENKIGTGFTDDPHENVSYKFNTLSGDLATEVTRSTNKDSELETAITNETAARTTKDAELTQGVNDLTAMIGTGFTTDPHENITYKFNVLSGAVTGESSSITALQTALNNETTARQNADAELNSSASTLDAKIGTGFTTGESSNITAKFAAEQSARTTKDSELENAITAESNARQSADAAINTTLNTATGNISTIIAEIGTGFTTGESSNITAKFAAEQSARTTKDSELENAITTESTARQNADSAINTTLNTATGNISTIIAEIGTGFTAENTIRRAISDIESEINTLTVGTVERVYADNQSIAVNNTDPKNPKVKVSLSTGATNIITLGADGIKSEVDLDYNSGTNSLTFTVNGSQKTLNLVGNTIIDNIVYSADTESIVITYTTPDGQQRTATCPVSGLITEWIVENPSEGSAVALTKSLHSVSGIDTLSARVLISNQAGNMVELNGNALFVNNSGITANATKIQSLESSASTLDGKITTVSTNLSTSAATLAAADTQLAADILAETNRATSAETAERTRAMAAEAELSGAISQHGVAVIDTNTVHMVNNAGTIQSSVKVSSTANNIIDSSKSDGLYVSAGLRYNSGTSQLTLETSNSESGNTVTLRNVSVSDGTSGAIRLTMDNSGLTDVISGQVMVSSDPDNVLTNQNGVLKVSNTIQSNIISGVGLSSNGTFIQHTSANYISGCTSVNEALTILDAKIKELNDLIQQFDCGVITGQ